MGESREPSLRVILLSHYYTPEIGAPQTRLRATARLLTDLGYDVRVITGPPHYPTGRVAHGYRAMAIRRDEIDTIPVLRLPVLVRPNRGLLNRVIDHATFAISAALAIWPVRSADVFVVESPPLFLGLTARFLRKVTGRPYIFHVADPWPDFPISMGLIRGRLPIALSRWLEARAYAGAALITTVTPALVARLDANPHARGKVRLLANGVDVQRYDPGLDPIEARRLVGWDDADLSIAYVGTVGLAQGVGTLIEAVASLRDRGVVLHVVGEGVDRVALERDAGSRSLGNVRFHAPVAAERIPLVLAAADALVVMLKRGVLYDESLPTKLVEALAAGRPIIASASGETARIVLSAQAGFVAPPEDVVGLRNAIVKCLEADDRHAMGTRARTTAIETYDRAVIVNDLATYLSQVAPG